MTFVTKQYILGAHGWTHGHTHTRAIIDPGCIIWSGRAGFLASAEGEVCRLSRKARAKQSRGWECWMQGRGKDLGCPWKASPHLNSLYVCVVLNSLQRQFQGRYARRLQIYHGQVEVPCVGVYSELRNDPSPHLCLTFNIVQHLMNFHYTAKLTFKIDSNLGNMSWG